VAAAGNEVSAGGPWFEIIGVVEDMLRSSRGISSPQTYHATALGTGPLTLAARTRGTGAAAIVPRVREIAAEIAPGLNLSAASMAETYEAEPAELGLLLLVVGLITLSVLLLSVGGISAMMSFAVTQRRREIGIRTALGASRREIVTSIFSRATRQLGVGLVIGLAGAVFLDRLAGGSILGGEVAPLLAFVAILMLLSGMVATMGPTRRALGIQPMEALRGE
jgi:ABC-type antimicrobial peptide transport system permease subunit